MTHAALNGFGRIGRTAFRVWYETARQDVDLMVINTSGSSEIEAWAHLLKYDSNYGPLAVEVKTERWRSVKDATDDSPELGVLIVGDHEVLVTAQRDPAKIPWGKYGVEVVIEATGAFTTAEKARLHLEAGARRVLLTAPAKDDGVSTVVLSVNAGASVANMNESVSGSTGVEAALLSNASCTTNCIAPVAAIMNQAFGVEKAMLTTVHAYTDDQNLHDNSHKDLRRARAAAQNIVPSSTGAALAAARVIPELQGMFDGLSIRVPVAVGSISDMVFVTKRPTSVEEVNQVLSEAADSSRWRGILAVTNEPLVSSDIKGRPESSIVDLGLTQVVGGNLVKVLSWYDNEYGYCNRLVELLVLVAQDVENHGSQPAEKLEPTPIPVPTPEPTPGQPPALQPFQDSDGSSGISSEYFTSPQGTPFGGGSVFASGQNSPEPAIISKPPSPFALPQERTSGNSLSDTFSAPVQDHLSLPSLDLRQQPAPAPLVPPAFGSPMAAPLPSKDDQELTLTERFEQAMSKLKAQPSNT